MREIKEWQTPRETKEEIAASLSSSEPITEIVGFVITERERRKWPWKEDVAPRKGTGTDAVPNSFDKTISADRHHRRVAVRLQLDAECDAVIELRTSGAVDRMSAEWRW